ncbi:MAG: hypothetical protein HFJ65_07645 [Eggerthellaceae bacterium]|nr:hypothetical protein [Eggerthellaceae bacterium]
MQKTESQSSIGIPQAMLYHKYGTLWETFFQELGIPTITSTPTTRATFEEGDHRSIDEACLASKVFLGHVSELLEQTDTIFVPAFGASNPREGFCTKFQSLPDMVRATFRDQHPNVVSFLVEDVTNPKKTAANYIELAEQLGRTSKEGKRAYKRALAAQRAKDTAHAKEQAETLTLIGKLRALAEKDASGQTEAPFAILIMAHPYIGHDAYVCADIISSIEEAGGTAIFADQFPHAQALKRSYDFSETLPWLVNREMAGAACALKDQIDGMVHISAFPCGPDSLFTDALARRMKDVPMLNLVIDAQSGSAGVQTRVESFMDILSFNRQGGYAND